MFDNIGHSLKTLAYIILVLGIIASVVLGAIIISSSSSNANKNASYWIKEDAASTAEKSSGIAVMIAGPISSIITSMILYGLGQAVENSDKLVQLMTNPSQPPKTQPASIPSQQVSQQPEQCNADKSAPQSDSVNPTTPLPSSTPDKIICPKCKYEQVANRRRCWNCGLVFNQPEQK